MWTHVQKLLNGGANGTDVTVPPAIPLRKSLPMLDNLAVGKTLRFSRSCILPPLTDATASIVAMRHYRFGDDQVKSYQLNVAGNKRFYLTVAEDEQGQYLGISRLLNEQEQDTWFGRDALSFFTEPSSAKSIRCKADLMVEEAWAASRYAKTVDWVSGSVSAHESMRGAHAIHYSLLVNEAGDKALEIEHEIANGDNRFYITVYRPVEDVVSIDLPHTPAPAVPHAAVPPAMATAAPMPSVVAANDDVPLFKEPVLSQNTPSPAQPKQRQDFRRLDQPSEPIHIPRTPHVDAAIDDEADVHLPSFLLAREGHYLSLDHVIPPEVERVRVGLDVANHLIHEALSKQVRVRDVLRNLLGLESAMADEVIFELPLTDTDYRTLAMRYKLRPDHRVEIRARLEEELRVKLTGIAKN